MAQIKFGLILPTFRLDAMQGGTFVDTMNRALEMASGHFDSVWAIDHLQVVLESFTSLAYMAALHPQLKFGHTVICQSFRNPALVAQMGATLQFLSGGRFLLGIGAGGQAEEHRAYGYDFLPGGARVAQLEEALRIIKALWTEKQASFTGKYYRIVDASCEPKPDPVPPVMVGAFGPKMLRLAARYADEWNVSSVGPARYRRLRDEFERACAEVGRDPGAVRRSWGCCCACAPTQTEAERITRGLFSAANMEDDFGFVGTPEQVIEQMQWFIDLGVDTLMFEIGGFPNLTTLEMVIDQVIPAING